MKNIIKSVIRGGEYELTDILKKIDTMYLVDNLTEADRDELYSMARENANPVNSMSPILDRVAALELRVKALEAAGGETDETDESGEPVESTTAEWVQPTGAHDAYNTGDRVMYDGIEYESTIDANVWSPDVYPQGWVKVEEIVEEPAV